MNHLKLFGNNGLPIVIILSERVFRIGALHPNPRAPGIILKTAIGKAYNANFLPDSQGLAKRAIPGLGTA